MHILAIEVYSDSSSVLLAVHSYSAEVEGHSDFEVAGVAVVADSTVVAALVGFDPLVGFAEMLVWVVAEQACCLDFFCLGNPSPCGQ